MNRGSGERGAVSALRNFEKEGREENDAVWEKFLDRVSPIRRGSVCFFFGRNQDRVTRVCPTYPNM